LPQGIAPPLKQARVALTPTHATGIMIAKNASFLVQPKPNIRPHTAAGGSRSMIVDDTRPKRAQIHPPANVVRNAG
jgi:hypothetical protein